MRGRVIVVGSVNVDLVVTRRRACPRRARPSSAAGSRSITAARAATRPSRRPGSVPGPVRRCGRRRRRSATGARRRCRRRRRRRGLATLEGEATGVALILVDAAGENSIAVASGANVALTPAHVLAASRASPSTPGDVVLVGHEIPTAPPRPRWRPHGPRGATTILNPAPADGLDRGDVGRADIVTPERGRAERPARVGLRAPRRSCQPWREGARLDAGRDGGTCRRSRSRPVDTVGAGDTLNGALAAGLAEGRPRGGRSPCGRRRIARRDPAGRARRHADAGRTGGRARRAIGARAVAD